MKNKFLFKNVFAIAILLLLSFVSCTQDSIEQEEELLQVTLNNLTELNTSPEIVQSGIPPFIDTSITIRLENNILSLPANFDFPDTCQGLTSSGNFWRDALECAIIQLNNAGTCFNFCSSNDPNADIIIKNANDPNSTDLEGDTFGGMAKDPLNGRVGNEIVINGINNNNIITDPNNINAAVITFNERVHTLLHEIGHTLGLNDIDPNDILFSTSIMDQCFERDQCATGRVQVINTLSNVDIMAINTLCNGSSNDTGDLDCENIVDDNDTGNPNILGVSTICASNLSMTSQDYELDDAPANFSWNLIGDSNFQITGFPSSNEVTVSITPHSTGNAELQAISNGNIIASKSITASLFPTTTNGLTPQIQGPGSLSTNQVGTYHIPSNSFTQSPILLDGDWSISNQASGNVTHLFQILLEDDFIFEIAPKPTTPEGTYTIILRVSNSCGPRFIERNITVSNGPDVILFD